ncbi:hypothetical protein [Sphingosinicella sp. CPCC 101087]|uniref:hypothetical protein n=1 Tax=Sphingosinicella sp. CPCC 101087 TaxID=2497754 RepID=UPI0013E9B5CD|nr:hypothetical protein [Sphingosinicella sp. CPCC 101087]
MSPEDADDFIPRDECDVLIDQYAFSSSDDYSRLTESGRVTLEIRSLDYCQAIQDMAFEVLDQSKSEFMAAVVGARSSEALSASYKVVAMRELLRQLLPIRDGLKAR